MRTLQPGQAASASSDLRTTLVDIALSGAKAAGARIDYTAQNVVDKWAQDDVLNEAKQIVNDSFNNQ